MKKLFFLLLLFSSYIAAQTVTQQQTISSSGGSVTIQNPNLATSLSLQYVFSGGQIGSTVTAIGCSSSGSCASVDSYTGNVNTTRVPSLSSVQYAYFVVSAKWSGGTNVSVTVTSSLVGSNSSPSGNTGLSYLTFLQSSSGPPTGNCAAINFFFLNTAATSGNLYNCPVPGSPWNLVGSTLPNPGSIGLCLVSTGTGSGNWTWGSCSGTTSTNWSAVVYDSPNASNFVFSGTPVFNNFPTFPSGTANQVVATPNGISGSPTIRALVSADLPAALSSQTSINGTTIPASITYIQSLANASHKWLNSFTQSTGLFTQTQPATTDMSDYGSVSPSGIFGVSNSATTVNGQSCALGGTCTVPEQVNSVNMSSQAGFNLLTSTGNTVGLTVTPTNSLTNQLKFEITGNSYTGNAGTATALATTPSQCGGGQFSTGIAANGNANCGTPTGSGTVNSGTAGHLAYYASSTTAVSDMGTDFTFLTHTLTGGASAILDLSGAATFKVPAFAGCTSNANGTTCYDTTNKNQHVRTNNADSIVGAFASAPVNGDVVSATVSAGNVLLSDGGAIAANLVTSTGAFTSGQIIQAAGNNRTLQSGNLSGDVTTSNSLVTALAAIDGTAVSLSAPAAGQIISVQSGPTISNAFPGVGVDAESGASYTVRGDGAGSDRVSLVQTTNNTTSTALSVPQAGSSGFDHFFDFLHINTGTVVATDTPTTSTINGNSTVTLVGQVAGHNPEGVFWYSLANGSTGNYIGLEILPTDANGLLAAEGFPGLTGDATSSSGSFATTVSKVNGGAIPLSAVALASNGSNQIIAATMQGNGTKVQASTGTTTSNDCVKFDANGNTVDAGAACAGGTPTFPITVAGTVTSGGIAYFNSTTQESSSGLLAANGFVLGGGAGAAPFTAAGITSDGTSVITLGVSTTSVGAIKFNNLTSGTITVQPVTGALGTVTQSMPAASGTYALDSGSDTTTTHVLHATSTGHVYAASAIATGDLPTSGIPNVAYLNTTNTFTSAGTLDLHSTTTANAFQVPSQAALTSNGTSSIGYDTTNKNLHIPSNGVDSFAAALAASGSYTNNDCVKLSVVTGTVTLADAGGACAGGAPSFPVTVAGTVTSGGIPYFNSTTQESSSALLATNAIVQGGGAGGAPTTGNGDFTIDSTAHTLKSGASGLVDFSAISGATGFKVPVKAGATAGAAGVVDYDSTAKLTHIATNNADSIAAATTSTSTTTTQALFATATAGVYNPRAIAAGDLPTSGISNVVYNNAANTGTTAMTLDMSAATTANAFKVPVGAGLTSGVDGAIAYDSTGKITHIRTNGLDSLAAATTTTSTTTTQVLHATSTAGVYTPSAIASGDLPVIGVQGQSVFSTSSGVAGSFADFDGGQFALGTNNDVCVQARSAETAWTTAGNNAAFRIVIPVNGKAYCSETPWISGARGDLYFIGQGARARIYTSVSWANIPNALRIHGSGPQGTTTTASVFNTQLVACNPLLHDNTWPTNPTNSAPCAAYFNSTTNMPQQTISSMTAASGGTATITLSGTLSGTPPPVFAGRFLCISADQTNKGCYEIKSEPSGNIYTVNSTSLVICSSSCGTAFLDTPLVLFGGSSGTPSFYSQVTDMGLDCAYVYGCGIVVNAGGQEGTALKNVQLFNATVYGYRRYVGNTSGSANSYNSGGAAHAGPDEGVFFNFLGETCEINATGCYGTDSTHSTAGFLEAAGTSMACGDRTVTSAGQAIIAYSSSVTSSTCQKTMAGYVSDGLGTALTSNSNSNYGINGLTISLKDVFNTGTHVRMPELTEGIAVFLMGQATKIDGFHTEYSIVGVEVGGNSTYNETWLGDGTSPTQGVTLISGDINNASSYNIDLGTANGTTNAMNFTVVNVSTTTAGATHQLQNNLVSNENCTTSGEKNIYYVFAQTATTQVIQSDCTSAQAIIPQLTNFPASLSAGVDGTTAGTLSLSNSAASAHTVFGSGATTTNTINGFATVPTTGHLIDCTVSSTTCLLHDSGVVTANVLTATPTPSAGFAKFDGSTLVLTSATIASADIATALTTPGAIGGTTPSTGAFTTLTGTTFNTTTRCAATGTGANPSVASCSAAASGSFSCATNASGGTCTINTSAVTANSAILVQPDSSLGALLSVTCNTTADTSLTAPRISARSAGTSFTITLGTFSTNPVCFSYEIIN